MMVHGLGLVRAARLVTTSPCTRIEVQVCSWPNCRTASTAGCPGGQVALVACPPVVFALGSLVGKHQCHPARTIGPSGIGHRDFAMVLAGPDGPSITAASAAPAPRRPMSRPDRAPGRRPA